MATSINVRLSDELEESLKNATPRGAEVNNSTIVRGALEDFIENIEEEKEGTYKFPIPLNLEKESGKKLKKKLQEIILSLGNSKEEEILSAHLEMIYQKLSLILLKK